MRLHFPVDATNTMTKKSISTPIPMDLDKKTPHQYAKGVVSNDLLPITVSFIYKSQKVIHHNFSEKYFFQGEITVFWSA